MKIAVYEMSGYEEPYFKLFAEQNNFELVSTGEPLSLENKDLTDGCKGVTVLGLSRVDRAVLEAVKKCGVSFLSTRTIGFDHIDTAAAGSLGIRVSHASYGPGGVAEFTVMLMLMVLRKYKPVIWRQQVNDYSLEGMLGKELRNQTVGVVGTGRIGAAVADILHGFGCRILGYDKNKNEKLKDIVEYTGLEELYRSSDVITFHMPYYPETYNMVSQEAIETMKDGVILINTARGELMDTKALIEGIETGKLGGLGLDVLAQEHGVYHFNKKTDIIRNKDMAYLRQFPNVILTPHIAFYTDQDVRDMVYWGVKSLSDMIQGKETPGIVPGT